MAMDAFHEIKDLLVTHSVQGVHPSTIPPGDQIFDFVFETHGDHILHSGVDALIKLSPIPEKTYVVRFERGCYILFSM
jgi:hypothetical protein